MQALQATSYLSDNNASYLENLYEQFLHDPSVISEYWQKYFISLAGNNAQPDVSHAEIRANFLQLAKQPQTKLLTSDINTYIQLERKQARVAQLINAYRSHGHHQAKLDPLGIAERLKVSDLSLKHHGLTSEDLDTVFNASLFTGITAAPLREIYQALQETYCGLIGIEYMHITDNEQTRWIQQRLESVRGRPKFDAETKQRILRHLTAAEGLEKYLGNKYVGQKRFSLEGADSMIPMLAEIIQCSASHHVKEIILGMAHRGRLNVLVNILGKAPSDLFQEFEGKHVDQIRSGDVKYHSGFSSDIKTATGSIHVALAFNPSHLEIIAPVVEGSVRARQQRRGDRLGEQVIPIQIHGDAAFAGQGVVMETFSFSQARGFSTGGTVHIIINNQIGFTTSNPLDARSTLYCTDVAKMVQAPVLHVNADDPEAVVFVTQLALEYRMTFKKDVVIDLVCYRRHGHNEADEPAATQPIMYHNIRQHPTTRKIYADRLIAENIITQQQADEWVDHYRDVLDKGKEVVTTVTNNNDDRFIANWKPYLDQEWTAQGDTSIKQKTLTQFAKTVETLPPGMVLQPQVAKVLEDRRQMTAGKLPINWGYAETLAYATLVAEGYPVRMSGQDSGRGTFAHRHAVLHDYNTGEIYTPLQHVTEQQAPFVIIDSLLSEEAVMGFEYGYATADPQTLVVWEAQFGDFANGAQVVIDQFISSGEQKWGRLCGLVLLLPHGYEGAGPEHSSARLERFLQLCAQHNMQVCVPTTPAQMFHMLRRQMVRPFRKPLIVMTPKSLLRHKLAVSSLDDLVDGAFYPVIPEIDKIPADKVKRVVLCCGKVYYDLLEKRRENKQTGVAIVRIEQLYPFSHTHLQETLKSYAKVKDIVWCQEEPKNQGAWYAIQHEILADLNKTQTLRYVGREASASPAAGSYVLHLKQQAALVSEALSDVN